MLFGTQALSSITCAALSVQCDARPQAHHIVASIGLPVCNAQWVIRNSQFAIRSSQFAMRNAHDVTETIRAAGDEPVSGAILMVTTILTAGTLSERRLGNFGPRPAVSAGDPQLISALIVSAPVEPASTADASGVDHVFDWGCGYGLRANHSLVIGSCIARVNATAIDLRLLLRQG